MGDISERWMYNSSILEMRDGMRVSGRGGGTYSDIRVRTSGVDETRVRVRMRMRVRSRQAVNECVK